MLRLILVFILILSSAVVAAADDMTWLKDTANALRVRNYQGIVVFGSGPDMRTLRIVHRFHNGREQERVQALSGNGVEILRDDDVVTCIHPRNRQVTVERRQLRGLMEAMKRLSEAEVGEEYRLVRGEDVSLLERSCRVYTLIPRDQFRYGYRVYSDAATHLPLKLETLNERQEVVEQMMFTQIEYPASIPDEALRPSEDASRYEWARSHPDDVVRRQALLARWQVRQLPPGFRLVSVRQREPIQGGDVPSEHMIYSDGLSTVSVFVAPLGSARPHLQGLSRMGAMSAFGRRFLDYQINVMGEVPAGTVELIGASLEPRPNETANPAPASTPAP